MKIFNHKKIFFGLLTLGFTSVFFNTYAQQNVSISDVSTTPDVSSVLDISSNNKGLLIPRVALTATNVASPITLPATSMLVYNTATAGVSPNNVIPGYYYNAGIPVAPNWLRIYAGSAAGTEWKLLGNVGTTAGTNFLGTTDAVDLVFRTNNTEKVRIMSGGNVGIGTSTPSAKLHVAGNGTALSGNGIIVGSINTALNTNVAIGSETGRFEIAFPGYRDVEPNQIGSKIASIRRNNYQANNALIQSSDLAFFTGSGSTGGSTTNFQDVTSERMRIEGTTGNVGVGTSSPSDRLDVLSSGGKNILLGGGATTGSELKFTNSGTAHFSIYNNGNSNLTFASTSSLFQTNTAGTALMSLTSTGNLGIGTTSPSQKLDVVGNVQFSQALMPNANAGTSGQVLISQGANTAPIWGANGSPSGITVFTSGSGTYTVPAGVTRIWVKIVGGGGAGASANWTGCSGSYFAGSGGGAGGYSEIFISSPASSYAYSVGAGGVGNTSQCTGVSANAGGQTTFGTSFLVANGGSGGFAGGNGIGTYYGGSGGTASGGQINITGQSGGTEYNGSGSALAISGSGGSSPFGFGGNGIPLLASGYNSAGFSGTGYGSGGSGAANTFNSTSAVAGGSGAGGIIIIYEYK